MISEAQGMPTVLESALATPVLWPVQRCVFDYLGLTTSPSFVAYGAPRVDGEVRREYLEAWRLRVGEAAAAASADIRS